MNYLQKKAEYYLNELCVVIQERSVGSEGNRQATKVFKKEMDDAEWKTESIPLDVIDWQTEGAFLSVNGENFNILSSPYSNGFYGNGDLVAISTINELEKHNIESKIVLLHKEIAKEQLMPKNFVFYNPDEHQRIIHILEKSKASAFICATGRNGALAGGSYPFPLIEDGDFDIPSVYMTDIEGEKLLKHVGKTIQLESLCYRIPAKAYNVTAYKNHGSSDKIVISAHIDAKKGTPGALDNAAGVVVLILLGHLLKNYAGRKSIELVAFNGEDYYAVPGQMNYIQCNRNNLDKILLNINIDGAGYKESDTAFSLYHLPDTLQNTIHEILDSSQGMKEGKPWVQGDHSIFVHFGIPALAVSSDWFVNNIDTQDITHTEKDTADLIDCSKLVDIAIALKKIIEKL